jgi:ParB family chromosome partitioning protein
MSSRKSDSSFQLIPLSQLKKSARNVRKTPHEKAHIEALADSLHAHGQIQNLVVETEFNEKQKPTGFYWVTAGEGRRLAQLLRVKRKQIKSDEPIRCVVDDERDASAISLAENELRIRMSPVDQLEAFKRLVDSGQSIEEVAAQFGVTPLVVQRRLKLANVCPDLIALYRSGQATLEQLIALAVVDDHAKQKAVWENTQDYDRHPANLRRLLTESEVDVGSAVARFVGVKAYLKAGGTVRRDLFSLEEDDGFITDAGLLQRLAIEKLERHAKKLEAEGFGWVRATPHMSYEERAEYGRVRMVPREPTLDEQVKLDALTARQGELDSLLAATDEEDARTDELAAEAEALEDELSDLRDSLYAPFAAEQAVAGAWVTIGNDGKVEIERGVLKAEDAQRFAKARKGRDVNGQPKAARTHSAPLMRRLSAHRTLALQATLIQRPDVALVVLVHRLAVQTFFNHGHFDGAVQIDTKKAAPEIHFAEGEGSRAREMLEEQNQQWRSMLPGTASTLFTWLMDQSQERLLSLCAYCVAITVNGVTNHEESNKLDALIEATSLDMKPWWQPTAQGYLSSISKARILDAVREATSPEIAATLVNLKKGECAKAAEKRLAGTGWLPSPLRGRAS